MWGYPCQVSDVSLHLLDKGEIMLDIHTDQAQGDTPHEAEIADSSDGAITMPPMTVLVVDGNRLVRAALTQVLQTQSAIKQFAVARDYSEGMVQTNHLTPDIIWLDLHITAGSAQNNLIEIHRLKQVVPDARILAITDVEDEQEAFEAIMGGAQGYRSKQDIDPDEIMTLIQALYQGEFVLRPILLARLMLRLRMVAMSGWHSGQRGSDSGAFNKLDTHAGGISLLTSREREVLQLIIQGQRDRIIAEQLHIAEKTVQKHVQGILNKLGVQNRTEAAYLIFNRGIYNS